MICQDSTFDLKPIFASIFLFITERERVVLENIKNPRDAWAFFVFQNQKEKMRDEPRFVIFLFLTVKSRWRLVLP